MASEVCASIPHPFLDLFVYRCEHRNEWVVWFSVGNDCSDLNDHRPEVFHVGGLSTNEELLGALMGVVLAGSPLK